MGKLLHDGNKQIGREITIASDDYSSIAMLIYIR